VGQARNAAILALNPVDGQWELFSLQGEDLQRAPVTVERNRLTLARWLIDQGRAQVLNTMPGDRRFMAPLTGASQVIHSLLAQPLSGRDGSLLAMIVLLNRLSGSFGEADFKALAALSEAAGRTLEQAGHYARTDHTLARRVQQLAALQRTARELNATMDPQAIADETLACAMAITAGEVGLVSVDVPGAGMVHHTWNVQVDSATIRRAFDLILEAPHALLVPADDDSFYSLLEPPGLRLVAPIRRSGHTLGLILVESALPQAFGEEALRAVASLADHAAVALDNTRLFNEIVREKRTADEIVDAVADALFTVDAQGQVIAFNPAAVMLTGWRAEEAIGHLVCNVLGCQQGADCQQHCDVLLALQGGQRIEQNHWTIRQRLGTQRVVALSAAPLPVGDGRDGGAVVLMRDVTEAWELERMQRELITAFSHELRTPLTNIGMITEMMLSARAEHGEALEREQLHLLQAQSRRLEEFAERILELNRLEMGAADLELAPLPLHLVLARCAQQWRELLPQRTIALSLPATELWVWAEEQAVRSVLDSLLDNASKYSPEGAAIALSAWNGPAGYATVAVDDQGPGVAPAHQPHLFDRFYRIDSSDSQRIYGYGLGLYLARSLVAQMAGQIWVESEADHGSRFAFTLPLMPEGFDEDPGDRR
jgi:PAS domain S-box-containing protein